MNYQQNVLFDKEIVLILNILQVLGSMGKLSLNVHWE